MPPVMREIAVDGAGGRKIHAYDSGHLENGSLSVMWHHGTPNIGLPPEPLFATADELGIRWIGYDRPGYGSSDPDPGRTIGSAASDAISVADALGVETFAAMGHSGGSPHALAVAALFPDRVRGVVGVSALAPIDADLDWFAGMSPMGEAGLRAASEGRDAKERYEAAAPDGDPGFTAADHAALEGNWAWFMKVVRPAFANGPGGLVDDDLAYVAPWGFDPAAIRVPVVMLHGSADRIAPLAHAEWLARHIRSSELWVKRDEGHISVLNHADEALRWLRRTAVNGPG
ncbi:MAG: alpha/beta fold hydrolase [Candidatus Limnocylindria bacterium]